MLTGSDRSKMKLHNLRNYRRWLPRSHAASKNDGVAAHVLTTYAERNLINDDAHSVSTGVDGTNHLQHGGCERARDRQRTWVHPLVSSQIVCDPPDAELSDE